MSPNGPTATTALGQATGRVVPRKTPRRTARPPPRRGPPPPRPTAPQPPRPERVDPRVEGPLPAVRGLPPPSPVWTVVRCRPGCRDALPEPQLDRRLGRD